MTQLQINDKEIKDIFETKFNSNQDKFMEFIVTFIKDNKKVVDNYLEKRDKPSFEYKKLDPMKNFHKLSVEKNDLDMTNPFKNIENSVDFAKKLREDSYR